MVEEKIGLGKKLVLGVTVPGSSRLLDGQVRYFINLGFDVYLLSPDHPKEHSFCVREGCTHLPVEIAKEISPVADIRTVFQIMRHLRRVKPDIVNVGTPKMGLLGMVASFLLRLPNRIYTCRGLRYESERGARRWLLKTMEIITVMLAKEVIYVGYSLLDAARKNGTASEKKAVVIGMGSSNGVNLAYFNRERVDGNLAFELAQKFELTGHFVIGYIGRVSRHKGSYELVEVFEDLHRKNNSLRLVMVGHFDCTQDLKRRVLNHPAIRYFEFQDNVPLFMSVFSLFVLPSWREGFSNALIQAAGMGLPVVASDATGCRDAIKDDFNGKVFPVRDKKGLKEKIQFYIDNPEQRRIHAHNSVIWAQNFESEIIWRGLAENYFKHLKK